jgi:choline dehydrogenase
VRGQREDYDRWHELGNPGWGYDDVLPYFIKSEDYEGGPSHYHGVGGPQKVSSLRLRREIAERFIEGAVAIGIPRNDDYNGAVQEGVGYFQQTAHKGFRWSTAKGFLRPARSRPNLEVVVRAHARKVLFEGRRAVGVEYQQDGMIHRALARGAVVLAAGAIGSPQLLQCSGVGDGELLPALGIPLVHHLPGVGESLQDHLQIRLVYKTKLRTLNDEVNNPVNKLRIGLEYMLFRTGPMTLAASQVTVFTRSDPTVERPDIQFHMQPLSADKPGEGPHRFSAFTASVCQLRPESRGHIRITSADPLQHPSIQPNYLSTELDRRVAVAGIKVARRIAATPSLAPQITEEFVPGVHYQSDDELLEAARLFSQTIYHPTSTCRMGRDDLAVVDARLRVHGTEGLRVVDASVMPEIISGNTNAPTIMIAEKAADMILEDARRTTAMAAAGKEPSPRQGAAVEA